MNPRKPRALAELHGEFVHGFDDGSFRRGVAREEAHGMLFLCPKCFAAQKGCIGTHSVLVWTQGAPSVLLPAPRWTMLGAGLEDVSLHPSIDLTHSCGWQGFVTQGAAA